MNRVLWLLVLQGVLGGLDTLYYHEWRARLSTSEFTVSRERVLLRSTQPPEDLRLFEFVARHQLRLAPDTIERLQGFAPKAAWMDWKRLLSLPRPAAGWTNPDARDD